MHLCWVSALYSIRDWSLVPETSENVMFAIRRGRLCLLCRFPRDTAVFATGFGGAQQCNLFEAPSMNGLCWSVHLPVSLACRTCAYFPEHILWRCKTQKQWRNYSKMATPLNDSCFFEALHLWKMHASSPLWHLPLMQPLPLAWATWTSHSTEARLSLLLCVRSCKMQLC